MTLRGHIRNGTLVFDAPPGLPEGLAVEVELRSVSGEGSARTLYDRFRDIIGTVDDLPEDFSINHDHYIHGTPKRESE